MKIHPAAEVFPAMTTAEYEELKADIKAKGLYSPIELYDGMILDGRHRYRACKELGVEPDTIKLDDHSIGGNPWEYVVSVNLHRRHLTTSQRGMIAVNLRRGMEHDAKRRQAACLSKTSKNAEKSSSAQNCANGRSADKAAAALAVSPRTVVAATKVQKDGAKAVVDAVNDGKISVSAAEKIVKESPTKAAQEKALKKRISGGTSFNVEEFQEDDPVEVRMENWNKSVESFARSITALAKEAPEGGWWDESQANITTQQLRSAAGSARQAKCDNICPKCGGKGCDWCKQTGFMPKRTYEMCGGK